MQGPTINITCKTCLSFLLELRKGQQSVQQARCASVQAPLLAHAMLHHPRAWPKQEVALGLLISLRKFYQTAWVRHWLLPICTATCSHDAASLLP